jgi:hypothetical protein
VGDLLGELRAGARKVHPRSAPHLQMLVTGHGEDMANCMTIIQLAASLWDHSLLSTGRPEPESCVHLISRLPTLPRGR